MIALGEALLIPLFGKYLTILTGQAGYIHHVTSQSLINFHGSPRGREGLSALPKDGGWCCPSGQLLVARFLLVFEWLQQISARIGQHRWTSNWTLGFIKVQHWPVKIQRSLKFINLRYPQISLDFNNWSASCFPGKPREKRLLFTAMRWGIYGNLSNLLEIGWKRDQTKDLYIIYTII